MRASGGTILGNWAIGSETSATAPTITVMIAMTIATMGRLMKNFDTARLLGRRPPNGTGFTAAPVVDLLDAVRHHPVAGMQPRTRPRPATRPGRPVFTVRMWAWFSASTVATW